MRRAWASENKYTYMYIKRIGSYFGWDADHFAMAVLRDGAVDGPAPLREWESYGQGILRYAIALTACRLNQNVAS